MAKVIEFHYDKFLLPKLSEEELKGLRDGFLEELKNYPPGIRVDTYADVEGTGIGICDWEVPDEIDNPVETVKKIVEKVLGEAPTDVVIEAVKVL